MVPLSATSLLNAWEQGTSQIPCRQALLLLSIAAPESAEPIELLPVGQRDSHLLCLRERLFGSRMECLATCPACHTSLEFSCEVSQLRMTNDAPTDELLSVRSNNLEVIFRVPNSSDVLDALTTDDADPEQRLLQCCVTAARFVGGEDVPVTELPDAVIAKIINAIDDADRQGNIQFDLTCPDCAHRWSSPFDIVSYLWAEVEDWAQRMIGDVHVLASAYGWREADILAMSAPRRKHYLDRVLQ